MTLKAQPFQSSFRSTSCALTDVGKQRALNEDRLLNRPSDTFWAVADGMGGHEGGEAAASRLIAALEAVEHGRSGFSRLSDVTRAVERVNATIFNETDQRGEVSGSTLVSLLVHDGHYACLWAGDSRAYLMRDGVLTAISHDHSVVQTLIDDGLLAEKERRTHPKANVITRAVGVSPEIALEQQFAPVADGDRFLLCSDGLNSCVDDDVLAQVLQDADGKRAANRLMALALMNGAPDNVTLIVVDIETCR